MTRRSSAGLYLSFALDNPRAVAWGEALRARNRAIAPVRSLYLWAWEQKTYRRNRVKHRIRMRLDWRYRRVEMERQEKLKAMRGAFLQALKQELAGMRADMKADLGTSILIPPTSKADDLTSILHYAMVTMPRRSGKAAAFASLYGYGGGGPLIS